MTEIQTFLGSLPPLWNAFWATNGADMLHPGEDILVMLTVVIVMAFLIILFVST